MTGLDSLDCKVISKSLTILSQITKYKPILMTTEMNSSVFKCVTGNVLVNNFNTVKDDENAWAQDEELSSELVAKVNQYPTL